ncbi:uncharacterized protein LOC104851784 [Fukomys damarensis]|uniref:uncharacterized protein LOC104851784 n=1 Tax=Fukomys damarensis TaxID=885580 RepID=UPI0014551040|nr:uncharacterized protein LOC104851784 [Fukomys damarensis]
MSRDDPVTHGRMQQQQRQQQHRKPPHSYMDLGAGRSKLIPRGLSRERQGVGRLLCQPGLQKSPHFAPYEEGLGSQGPHPKSGKQGQGPRGLRPPPHLTPCAHPNSSPNRQHGLRLQSTTLGDFVMEGPHSCLAGLKPEEQSLNTSPPCRGFTPQRRACSPTEHLPTVAPPALSTHRSPSTGLCPQAQEPADQIEAAGGRGARCRHCIWQGLQVTLDQVKKVQRMPSWPGPQNQCPIPPAPLGYPKVLIGLGWSTGSALGYGL